MARSEGRERIPRTHERDRTRPIRRLDRTSDHPDASRIWKGIVAASIAGLAGASLVRIAGFGRQVATARAFGLGEQLDIFLLASTVPLLIGSVVGPAINTLIIPKLTPREADPEVEPGSHIFWNYVWSAFVLGLIITVTLWALAEPVGRLLSSGKSLMFAENVSEVVRLLAFLPGLVILYEVIAGGLVSRSRFAAAAVLPVFVPVTIALSISMGVRSAVGLGKWTVIGAGIVVAVGLITAHRNFGWPVKDGIPKLRDSWRLGKGSLALLVAMILAQTTIFIDKVMAGSLGTGSVSALEFGSRIPEAVIGVGGLAIANATAVFSSRMTQTSGPNALASMTKKISLSVGGVGTVLLIALVVASPWLVRSIYVGQQFSLTDAHRVTTIQIAYLFQIPFYLIVIVTSRVLASMAKTKWITLATLIHLFVSVSGNLILMERFGVSGIAAATSIAYVITALGLLGIVTRISRTK